MSAALYNARVCVGRWVWVAEELCIQASVKVTFTPNKQLKLIFDWQENIHSTLVASHCYLITN